MEYEAQELNISSIEKSLEDKQPSFCRARTTEQIRNRKEEILKACVALYEEGGYGAVNFKAISEMTSFTRQSIYRYYKTKEEIFLELLAIEQQNWANDLYEIFEQNPSLSEEEYALCLTSCFSAHGMMLELIGVLFNQLEINSQFEKLVDFRKNSVDVYHILLVSVAKYFPTMSKENHHIFVSTVFAFAVGLYPMNNMSKTQLEAERVSGTMYFYPESFNRSGAFETSYYNGILHLLKGLR